MKPSNTLTTLIGLFLSSTLIASCGNSTATLSTTTPPVTDDNTLTIWWERGYYVQEDEAIEAVIEAWEAETGNNVEISFRDQDTIIKETENALKAGQVPDILFSLEAKDTSIPYWAWNGQLADVSNVVEPLRDTLRPSAFQSIQFYNNVEQKRAAYAVPVSQQTVHIHYWRDMLAEAGLDEADIPTEWDEFWDFWKVAQDNLRAQGKSDLYAMGIPMSQVSSDAFNSFYQVLEAYDIDLLDNDGNLLIDTPQMRQKLAAALDWHTSLYTDGYVPEAAATWPDSGNNKAFLNREVLMVVNPTLSIPGSQREDDPENYHEKIATIEFPNEPDGDVPTYFVNTNKAIIFKDSLKQDLAEEFLTFLMQPENIEPYLKGSLGRYFPISDDLVNAPFWNDPADPHIFVGNQKYMQGNTRAAYYDINGAYSQVNIDNIWGKAIASIVSESVSPEDAADQAIDQIVQIFTDYKK